MTSDKFININEPLNESFQLTSCGNDKLDELNKSIDKFISFFKKLDSRMEMIIILLLQH